MQFHKTHATPFGPTLLVKCYSPTMDLLALVLEGDDQQVHIHRNNFQRLFSVKINCSKSDEGFSIRAACFKPDGKILAVGCEDGTLHLVDIESASVTFACETVSEITNLVWSSRNLPIDISDKFLWEKKAQPLLKLEDPNTLAMSFDTENVDKEQVAPCVDVPDTTMQQPLFQFDPFNVLVVTTVSEIQLRANGSFVFLRLPMNNQALWASIAANMEILSFMSNTSEGNLLSVVRENVFAPHTIEDVAKSGRVWSHVYQMLRSDDMATGCIKHMEESWSAFYKNLYTPLFEKLKNQMTLENVRGDIGDAFAQVLVSGTVDHPTMQWISTVATEQHLTKLIRQLQITHRTLRKYAVDYLQRYLQHILLGLSSVLTRKNQSHEDLLSQVSTLLVQTCKGGAFTIDEDVSNIQHFLQWLRHVHQRISGKTPARNNQQQAQQPLPMEPITNSKISKYLIATNFENRIDSVGQTISSLKEGFDKLADSADQVFATLCDNMSSAFAKQLPASTSEHAIMVQPADSHLDQDGNQLVAFRHELYVVLMRIKQDQIERCTIELCQLASCYSIHFYINDAESLFCIGTTEEGFVRMMMLPLGDVQWQLFTEFGECFMDPETVEPSKVRDFETFNEVDSVAIGDKRGLACIVLKEAGKQGKTLHLFDLEDDEEVEEEETGEEQMDGEDSVMAE